MRIRRFFSIVAAVIGSVVATGAWAESRPWPYPDSLDAVVASPLNYKVLFENDRLRVLQVTTYPHEREKTHTHRWPAVLLYPFRERLTRPTDWEMFDGAAKMLTDSRKEAHPFPVVAWQPSSEGPHAVENLSDEDFRFYRFEIKPHVAAARSKPSPYSASLDGPVGAPDNHKVILENDTVRVLELTGRAHERERVHTHPYPSVSIMMNCGEFRVYGERGETVVDSRSFDTPLFYPLVHWDDPWGPHAVEDLSGKPWHGYRVELKQ